jgi:hypothetical protein
VALSRIQSIYRVREFRLHHCLVVKLGVSVQAPTSRKNNHAMMGNNPPLHTDVNQQSTPPPPPPPPPPLTPSHSIFFSFSFSAHIEYGPAGSTGACRRNARISLNDMRSKGLAAQHRVMRYTCHCGSEGGSGGRSPATTCTPHQSGEAFPQNQREVPLPGCR